MSSINTHNLNAKTLINETRSRLPAFFNICFKSVNIAAQQKVNAVVVASQNCAKCTTCKTIGGFSSNPKYNTSCGVTAPSDLTRMGTIFQTSNYYVTYLTDHLVKYRANNIAIVDQLQSNLYLIPDEITVLSNELTKNYGFLNYDTSPLNQFNADLVKQIQSIILPSVNDIYNQISLFNDFFRSETERVIQYSVSSLNSTIWNNWANQYCVQRVMNVFFQASDNMIMNWESDTYETVMVDEINTEILRGYGILIPIVNQSRICVQKILSTSSSTDKANALKCLQTVSMEYPLSS